MPVVELSRSALAPGLEPVPIHYRRSGNGFPLLFLHGGWGYAIYALDAALPALEPDFSVLIPDRSGYGRSSRLECFALPLHPAAVDETLRFMDALGLERCALWGHSDGAVIAANLALAAPERVAALVLEAIHYDRKKAGSREFFLGLFDPGRLDARSLLALVEDHGEDYWQRVVDMENRAWGTILAGADAPEGDLYGGRLGELRVPTLVLHGSADPRTEPGELEAVRELLPRARFHVIPGAKHSPHSERASAAESARVVREFLLGAREGHRA
jgi:pimeloyl-ACP methyl ester carboxylesterase